jgi:hypothetical protein
VQRQHAGQFVGVQTGLQHHLGARPGHTKVLADQRALCANGGGNQGVNKLTHAKISEIYVAIKPIPSSGNGIKSL